jgi:hypothetical protein
MLSIFDHPPRLCDRLPRREVLRAGALGLSAGLLSRTALSAPIEPKRGKAKRVIVLFLLGGPPQQSTWDPKPEAPLEIRGQFGPIRTNVPGLNICELMPDTARIADKLAVLRAVVTGDNAHSSSGYAMMTGQPHIPLQVENANPGPPSDSPTMGAIVQHLHRGPRLLPPAVRLPMHIFNTDQSVWPGQDSGFLGHAADPWLFRCEPASPTYAVPQFQLQADVSLGRLDHRQSLLSQLESQLHEIDRGPAFVEYGSQREQALTLLGTAKAREACDLNRESAATRDRYGRSQFGQSVLLARRLVEADVSFVQVNWFRGVDEPPDNPCWDSHTDETNRLKNVLVPPWDRALAALIGDLSERGLLDDTLVACLAEFGRTPRFNARAGRDHWGHVFSVALAGGGIKGGVVHGASDGQGGYPVEGIVAPCDITATIFDRLGYPPETEIHDPLGRPLPISRGTPISAILS